jgi:hypothetical protein
MADGPTKFPTEVIELPSKGWFYPEGHPLAAGTIELFYMTAKHEDILTSRNLIEKGVVIDKLMESLIANKSVKYGDLLIGDRNAIMVASRILGYGKEYQTDVSCPKCERSSTVEINLEDLGDKEIEFKPELKNRNEFSFELPTSKSIVTFRLLNYTDERNAQKELEMVKKGAKMEISQEVTTRMRYSILSVDGDRDRAKIKDFVENMLARDAMEFRRYAKQVNPDIDLSFDFECAKCGHEDRIEVPIDVTFFWPNARV